MFEMLCKIWRIEKHSWVLNHYVENDLFNVFPVFVGNIVITSSECGQRAVSMGLLDIGFRFFFVTIFISFFTCTCYRYKTFIQYQKKKRKKRKAPSKRKEKIGEL